MRKFKLNADFCNISIGRDKQLSSVSVLVNVKL